MITTITLNPALDKTIAVDALSYGEVNRVGKAQFDTGGKGINVSKVLGKLGTNTTAIGFLGKKNKIQMLELLEKELMDTEFVYLPEETRTNLVLVELEKKITTNINEEGFLVDGSSFEKMKLLVNKYAEKSEYMVFSGSAPKGLKDNVYKELIGSVNDKTYTVLDADDDLLLEGLKANPFMIKPNIYELENAFDTELNTEDDVIELSRRVINEYKITIVLISMGSEGCLLVTKEDAYKAMPVKMEVKSTVGAGDSLIGGFLHGLVNKFPLETCLAYGTVCGAFAVARKGVGNFTVDEVTKLLDKVKISKK